MTEIQLATALMSCLSLAGLWVLLFKLYPDYCVDRFRQDMFDLRADLFDDLQIAHGHPAYGLLRQTMNGFIRFGHRVNLLHVVVFFLQTGGRVPKPSAFSTRWTHALQGVKEAEREHLEAYRERMDILVAQHLVRSSPLLVFSLVGLVLGVTFSSWCIDHVRRYLRRPLEDFNSAAVAYGRLT